MSRQHNTRYQIGDMVTIRSDLNKYDTYYMDDGVIGDGVTSSMMELQGRYVGIVAQSSSGKYTIDCDHNNWTDDMFINKPLTDEEKFWKVVNDDAKK